MTNDTLNGGGNTHRLKTHSTCWDAIERGEKRFEARRDDRFFQRGDTVILQRLCPLTGGLNSAPGKSRVSTRDLTFRIGWMLRGEEYGIKPGFVVFQLEPMESAS